MRGSRDEIISIVASVAVQERLTAALAGLDVTLEGDDTHADIVTKLERGIFQVPTGYNEVRHWTPARLQKRKSDSPLWFEQYMPPIVYYWYAQRMGWRILLGGSEQPIGGPLVHEIATRGAEKLLAAWDEQGSELLWQPLRYPVLEAPRRSRAWMGMQILLHANSKKITLCNHCQRYEWESLPTIDAYIVLVTGVDEYVAQADWLVYRRTRPLY